MSVEYHTADDIVRLNSETARHFEDRDRLAQAELRGISEQAGDLTPSSESETVFDRVPNVFFLQCHIKKLDKLADELAMYDLEAAEAVERDILALSLFSCQMQAFSRRQHAAHVGNAEGLLRSREHLIDQLADDSRRSPRLWRHKKSHA